MADIEVHGPFFDGRSQAVVDAMCDAITFAVADEGQAIVLTNLHSSIKRQTPFYTTRIAIKDAGVHAEDVHDSGVIYGPWLEGVGSRNYPATRFRGYASFRRATQYLNSGPAETIANRVARGFVGRM